MFLPQSPYIDHARVEVLCREYIALFGTKFFKKALKGKLLACFCFFTGNESVAPRKVTTKYSNAERLE